MCVCVFVFLWGSCINSSPSSVIERKLLFLHILSMIENIYKRQPPRMLVFSQPLPFCLLPLFFSLFFFLFSCQSPFHMLPSAFQIFNKAPDKAGLIFFTFAPLTQSRRGAEAQLFLLARLEARDIRALAQRHRHRYRHRHRLILVLLPANSPAVHFAKCQGLANAIQFFMHLPHLEYEMGMGMELGLGLGFGFNLIKRPNDISGKAACKFLK